ncbi:MAG: PQQ-binding-like beta-propeller repeat protein, partial [Planctomycetota bacterium]|nr:PQQ-binding-like beta-propeller repeat protein [Planctomycetota bacterium]
AESRQWPPLPTNADWPTFAGAQWRNKIAPSEIDPAAPAWRIRLCKRESKAAVSSFHPAVVGNLVFVATAHEILGLDLRTGKPAWGQVGEGGAGGAIFRDELADSRATRPSRKARAARLAAGMMPGMVASDALGPRTLTVRGGRLFAAMCSPSGDGYMICLDLEAEGRLLWRIEPENDDWAFEGAPVCDGPNVYVAMRMIGIRPQAYVGCFDAQTGRRRWRRYICGADAAASAMRFQPTRQLLTLKGRRIYYNTNLGVVAALSTVDGQLEWISLYPQTKRPQPSRVAGLTGRSFQRNLNPCLYHRGLLYVAPADSPRIFALDAVTGQIVWQTGSQVENVTHLLGVSGDRLIASGKRLYWIETGTTNPAAGGKLKHVWPRAERAPGFGRGILAGEHIYWPTHEKIYIFNQRTAQLVKSIELGPKKASGGNLTIAHGRLLIATTKELITFNNTARKNPKTKDEPSKAAIISMPTSGKALAYGFRN